MASCCQPIEHYGPTISATNYHVSNPFAPGWHFQYRTGAASLAAQGSLDRLEKSVCARSGERYIRLNRHKFPAAVHEDLPKLPQCCGTARGAPEWRSLFASKFRDARKRQRMTPLAEIRSL
jgi:hypothetical protein